MERLLVIGGLFVLAGMCEIGGGYPVWGWMREHKPLLWALLGAVVLATYGVVAALQPITEFGRVYAAYGGFFIALALLWGVVVYGFRPRPLRPAWGVDLRGGRRGDDGRSAEGIAALFTNCLEKLSEKVSEGLTG